MVILKFIIGGILNLMKYGIYSFSFYNSFLLLSWSCFCCFLYVLMYSVLDSILEMFCTYSFKFSFNQALFKAVVFLIFKGFRFGFFFFFKWLYCVMIQYHPCKVSKSVVFSVFTESCSHQHQHNQFYNTYFTLKRNPHTWQYSLPFSSSHFCPPSHPRQRLIYFLSS